MLTRQSWKGNFFNDCTAQCHLHNISVRPPCLMLVLEDQFACF